MRTEQQVYHQLLGFAQRHEDIRAVVMNGSRVNPNAPRDFFQDFDVVYFVQDPHPYLVDQSWIKEFGELIILQQNDYEDHGLAGYIFLMLFSDGVRIDLSYNALSNLAYIAEDTLTAVLLDKDGRIPPLPAPDESGYYPSRPTRKEFAEAVNEVFWCSNNLAKGIWRDELPYVKYMQDVVIRDMIIKLLEWYAAMQHGWASSSGSYGKWLKKYLPPDVWDLVVKIYPGADYAGIWDAMFAMCALTRKIGTELSEDLGYDYPLQDDERVVEYLRHVRSLPKNAQTFH